MNIHVLPKTPLKKEFFVTNVTLFILSLAVGFQVGLILPALTEDMVTKLTTELFWVVQINILFSVKLIVKRFPTFIRFKRGKFCFHKFFLSFKVYSTFLSLISFSFINS